MPITCEFQTRIPFLRYKNCLYQAMNKLRKIFSALSDNLCPLVSAEHSEANTISSFRGAACGEGSTSFVKTRRHRVHSGGKSADQKHAHIRRAFGLSQPELFRTDFALIVWRRVT